MAEYKYKVVLGTGWGRMPCHEVRKFDSEEEYRQAYYDELDEIADQLAKLYERMEQEYPEDYSFIVA